MSSWFSRGNDPNSTKFRDENANPRSVMRFWMKPGEKKRVLFLGDERFQVWEGTLNLGGNRFETYTCSCDENSFFLKKNIKRSFVEHCTVLDLTPFTDKQGNQRTHAKRSFAASGSAIEMLNRRREKAGGSLVGWIVECSRDGDKSPRVGNDFELVQKVDFSKYKPEEIKPFDYPTLLKPLPYSMLEAIMSGGGDIGPAPQTTSRKALAEAEVSDVPF